MASTRLSYLDSIRGIATILVFIQHIILHLRRENVINVFFERITFWTVDILDFGKIGVVLFFMLSGFLIPSSIKPNTKIKMFIMKRFFRLYPVFWLSIILGVVFMYDTIPDFKTLLGNITMLPEIFGKASVLGVYWTLQIELIFYGVCLLLFVINSLHSFLKVYLLSLFFIFIGIIASIFRFYLEIKLPIALFLALSLMLYGYILKSYISFREKKSSFINNENQKFVKLYPIVFSISMLLISFLAYNRNYGFNEVWYRYFFSYIIAFMLFLLLISKLKIKNKFLSYFGEISYSFYLFHVICIYIVGLFLNTQSIFSNIVFSLVSFTLSTIVSVIGYNLVEKTFIKVGYKFLTK